MAASFFPPKNQCIISKLQVSSAESRGRGLTVTRRRVLRPSVEGAVGRRTQSGPNCPPVSQTTRFSRWQPPCRKTTARKRRVHLPKCAQFTAGLRRRLLRICSMQGQGKRIRFRSRAGGVSSRRLPLVPDDRRRGAAKWLAFRKHYLVRRPTFHERVNGRKQGGRGRSRRRPRCRRTTTRISKAVTEVPVIAPQGIGRWGRGGGISFVPLTRNLAIGRARGPRVLWSGARATSTVPLRTGVRQRTFGNSATSHARRPLLRRRFTLATTSGTALPHTQFPTITNTAKDRQRANTKFGHKSGRGSGERGGTGGRPRGRRIQGGGLGGADGHTWVRQIQGRGIRASHIRR